LSTAVFPSLNENSAKSSSPFFPAPPLRFTTPLSITFAFFPVSAIEIFEISGRESALVFFSTNVYI
jgi:hypothetical protein